MTLQPQLTTSLSTFVDPIQSSSTSTLIVDPVQSSSSTTLTVHPIQSISKKEKLPSATNRWFVPRTTLLDAVNDDYPSHVMDIYSQQHNENVSSQAQQKQPKQQIVKVKISPLPSDTNKNQNQNKNPNTTLKNNNQSDVADDDTRMRNFFNHRINYESRWCDRNFGCMCCCFCVLCLIAVAIYESFNP